MKPSRITAALGLVLVALGVWAFVSSGTLGAAIPVLIGAALIFLAFNRSRVGTLVFGHTCIVVGAYMITWGLILLPHTPANWVGIFGRPLFWGIFSVGGGVCAIFHGFCRCVTKQVDQFEGIAPRRETAA
jgi:hypothetical protein